MNKVLIGTSKKVKKDALQMVKEALGTDNIYSHPDFIEVNLREGKSQIVIDDIIPIVNKGVNPPVLVSKAYAIIDDASLLNIEAQNKLLKTIEDSSYIDVIFVASRDTLLRTIKSRCNITEYRPMTQKAFFEMFSEFSPEDAQILFYASGGDDAMVDDIKEFIPLYHQIATAISQNKPQELFRVLHILNEKDKEVITEKWFYFSVISFMENIFLQICETNHEYVKILHILSENKVCLYANWYTKNNFFSLIVNIVEEILNKIGGKNNGII